jgi:hypothetical protein
MDDLKHALEATKTNLNQLLTNKVTDHIINLDGPIDEQIELDIDNEMIVIRDLYFSLDLTPRKRLRYTEEFYLKIVNFEENVVKLPLRKGYEKYAILQDLLKMNGRNFQKMLGKFQIHKNQSLKE